MCIEKYAVAGLECCCRVENTMKKIGEITLEVIDKLGLPLDLATPIYIGATNIAHIKSNHNYEYERFYNRLSLLISTADYVRLRKNDNSIEYVKLVGKHVKLAVRVAGDGNYYVRSLYFIERNRVENLLKKGELKTLTQKKR